MDLLSLLLYASIAAGFLMAFSLGANDVANSMAPSVGARAITVRQAVFIAAGLNFVGAVFFGSEVTDTICRGIVPPEAIGDPNLLAMGMFAALLSAGLWVLLATFTGLPVSSTHSIVGSIVGFGIVAGGVEVVNWSNMGNIVLSWLVSPFFGGLIAFLIFIHIRRFVLLQNDPVAHAKFWVPVWGALTLGLVVLSFLYKTPFGQRLHLPLYTGLGITAVSMTILAMLIRWVFIPKVPLGLNSSRAIEKMFQKLQIATACYVAISQGANDVANAVGPVASIFAMSQHNFSGSAELPLWLLAMGGVGIACGISLLGYKVIATMGQHITKLTNTRGFAVAFGAATTVLIASHLGMPVSTSHAAVGAIVGVGVARGFKAVDFRVLSKIVLYWVLTVPITAFTCIVIYEVLRFMVY